MSDIVHVIVVSFFKGAFGHPEIVIYPHLRLNECLIDDARHETVVLQGTFALVMAIATASVTSFSPIQHLCIVGRDSRRHILRAAVAQFYRVQASDWGPLSL